MSIWIVAVPFLGMTRIQWFEVMLGLLVAALLLKYAPRVLLGLVGLAILAGVGIAILSAGASDTAADAPGSEASAPASAEQAGGIAGWPELAPPGKGFRVRLPIVPKGRDAGEGQTSYVVQNPEAGYSFNVFHQPLPEAGKSADIEASTLFVAMNGKGWKPKDPTRVRDRSGTDGVEIRAVTETGETVITRMFIVGKVQYQLVVTTKPGAMPQAEMEAFFDSFELSKAQEG